MSAVRGAGLPVHHCKALRWQDELVSSDTGERRQHEQQP